MLVLSRLKGQKLLLQIPPSSEPLQAEVEVVDIRGDKVRLGITAPKLVDIKRNELIGKDEAAR